MKGRIHSIETSGFFDGPGIRTVVFFQGCPLRCIYCHNPDTWDSVGGESYSTEELMEKIRKYKNYYRVSNGGVTFSGGEPLMQGQFLLAMLQACKAEGIHTAVDTSGILIPDRELLENILSTADCIILDVKGTNPEQYQQLTGRKSYDLPGFLELINKLDKKIWLRYVMIPGINDRPEDVKALQEIMAEVQHLVKLEVLPFHQAGHFKYEELGITYPLAGHPEMDARKARQIQKQLTGA